MEDKEKYREVLEKILSEDYTEQEYIEFFTYYFTEGYKKFSPDEKEEFYDIFQEYLIGGNKISSKLFCEIDDICQEIDWATAEVDPNYFEEYDHMFIKLLKEHGFLKE